MVSASTQRIVLPSMVTPDLPENFMLDPTFTLPSMVPPDRPDRLERFMRNLPFPLTSMVTPDPMLTPERTENFMFNPPFTLLFLPRPFSASGIRVLPTNIITACPDYPRHLTHDLDYTFLYPRMEATYNRSQFLVSSRWPALYLKDMASSAAWCEAHVPSGKEPAFNVNNPPRDRAIHVVKDEFLTSEPRLSAFFMQDTDGNVHTRGYMAHVIAKSIYDEFKAWVHMQKHVPGMEVVRPPCLNADVGEEFYNPDGFRFMGFLAYIVNLELGEIVYIPLLGYTPAPVDRRLVERLTAV
ncbi:hypothetical protein CC1G_04841 [Coprinopsis cinerea okayama7|uniref:Uncharacterized protein n=1 Tax=Coprinopsis cinerea (strain Okayama-7 / 130 / ATCC MYA-4618 / FGSC 9003) TaxID=240176 RepID=A8PFR9_COPC7|nr:hypothetical protein CC1G_04841 [Coprinopsis cinerea okayama7\|eukprot:XP_001840997.1 hypothetical protein CC1G_04841 [Coprinopsis cinerea okayama7\